MDTMMLQSFYITFFPLLQCLTPVGGTIGYSLLLALCLVAGLVACALFLHGGNSGIVENLYGSSLDCLVEFFLAECLALHVEVGDIKLKVHSELMSYHLLLESRTCVFPAQQLADDVYFML